MSIAEYKMVQFANRTHPLWTEGNSTLEDLDPNTLCLGTKAKVEMPTTDFVLVYAADSPLAVHLDGKFAGPMIGARWVAVTEFADTNIVVDPSVVNMITAMAKDHAEHQSEEFWNKLRQVVREELDATKVNVAYRPVELRADTQALRAVIQSDNYRLRTTRGDFTGYVPLKSKLSLWERIKLRFVKKKRLVQDPNGNLRIV